MYLVKHLPFRLMEPVSKLPTPSVAIETRPPTISTASPTLKKKEFRRSFSFKNLISGPHQFCDGQNILQPGRPPHRPHVDGRYQTWGKTWIFLQILTQKKRTGKTDPKKEPVTAIAIRVSAHRLLSSPGSLVTLKPFVSEHVKKDKMDGVILGKTITTLQSTIMSKSWESK